ncbi:MAG: hypothetical protein ACAI25_08800 [Planctomycetota bacterium]
MATPTYLEQELQCFSTLVEGESWKRDHEDPTACLGLENVLQLGILVYDSIMVAEEAVRRSALDDPSKFTEKTAQAFRDLKKWWLAPCDRVEKEIKATESKIHSVDHAVEFRKRVEECRWLLAPASKAFNSTKVVDLRDAALDERRPRRSTKRRHG